VSFLFVTKKGKKNMKRLLMVAVGCCLITTSATFECKKIYLANPMGFSEQQKRLNLPELVKKIESLGIEVIEPWSHAGEIDMKKKKWAFHASQMCLKYLDQADAIFAVVNGNPPDEGVMIELGYAIAKKKKVFLFRDDFRNCTDSETYPLNLMVFSGCPKYKWRYFYYTSVDEISSPIKALYNWAHEATPTS